MNAALHAVPAMPRTLSRGLPLLALAVSVACTAEHQPPTAPDARTPLAAKATTSATYTLSSVTPPIQCVDAASGATTTVTGGMLTLASNTRFTATFTTARTSTTGAITTGSYTEKGTYTRSGSTITFTASDGSTFVGTVDDAAGTITIADYSFCGTTHTAVFVLN